MLTCTREAVIKRFLFMHSAGAETVPQVNIVNYNFSSRQQLPVCQALYALFPTLMPINLIHMIAASIKTQFLRQFYKALPGKAFSLPKLPEYQNRRFRYSAYQQHGFLCPEPEDQRHNKPSDLPQLCLLP